MVRCLDPGSLIWVIPVEDNVDSKLALIPEEFRQGALEAVEERRASELSCEEDLEQTAEQYAKRRGFYLEGFVLPSSLSNRLGVANSFGILLIMILAASAMGVEYGWGTVRTALTRGVSRWQFLSAKVLSLLLLGGAGFFIVGLSVVVSSLILASLISGDGGGLADSGQWSTVTVMFAKAVYGLAPYVMLALFVSVLTSSSSIGIAISMAYFFVELILIQVNATVDLSDSTDKIAKLRKQIDGNAILPKEPLEKELESRSSLYQEWADLFGYQGCPRTDGLLATIFAAAQETGIRLSSMVLGDQDCEIGERLQYETQAIDITLRGDSHSDIFRFLSKLHAKIPSVEVLDINLAGFQGAASAEAVLLFYLAPEPVLEEGCAPLVPAGLRLPGQLPGPMDPTAA